MLFSTPIAKILFPIVTYSYLDSEDGLLMGPPTSRRITFLIVHHAAATLWSMSCGTCQSCHNHFKSLIGFHIQPHASVQAIFFTWNSWEIPGQRQVSPPREVFPQQSERESHSFLSTPLALSLLPAHAWWVIDRSVKMMNVHPLLPRSSP